MDLKEEEILGDKISTHWYYRAKFAALQKMTAMIPKEKIIDIGAGTGYFSRKLLEETECQEAVCVDIGYQKESKENYLDKNISFTKSLSNQDFQLALLMDVLEHVDDDVGLLQSYVDQAPKGTYFFITVPAFSFVWSEHDDFLEHKRRYELAQIESVAEKAGLEVVNSCYFYGLLFPLVVLTRFFTRNYNKSLRSPKSQLKQHNFFVNALLYLICKIEITFFTKNRIGGLSAVCLARK